MKDNLITVEDYINEAHSYFPDEMDMDKVVDRRKDFGVDERYYPSIHSFRYLEDKFKKANKGMHDTTLNVLDYLENLSETEDIKLLDVGAGLGQILYYFFRNTNIYTIHGIEVDDDYIDIFNNHLSEYFINASERDIKLYHMDAFDFERYDEYNMIWTYSPIRDRNYCMELYDYIINNSKVGTYFIDFDFGSKYTEMMEAGYPIEVDVEVDHMKIFKRKEGNFSKSFVNNKKDNNTMERKEYFEKINFAEKNINWDEFIIPQEDGKDVELFQEILKETYGYEPLDTSDSEHFILDNEVALNFNYTGGNIDSADPDYPSIQLLDEVFDTWPEMKTMIKKMTDHFYPALPVDEDRRRAKGPGCSCGIYGKPPHKGESDRYDVSIMATVNGAVGAAEGIVHELGHHKLHALGIDLEFWTGQFFENGEDEVFHSPVRFDKKRPIAAVVQAEFSYVYVTEFYNKFIQWMLDNDMDRYEGSGMNSFYNRQAYNLKRIGNGIHTIKEVAKLTDEGERFMKSFMEYAEDVWTRGYMLFKENGVLDDYDWEPVEGIPVEIENEQ